MWRVISPRVGRESASVLQEQINLAFPTKRDMKINWGCSSISTHDPREVFGNKPEGVARSANKRIFFNLCSDLGTVPVAKPNGKYHPLGYFIHHDPGGHNGAGVSYTSDKSVAEAALRDGTLVTKAIKGKEYRVYFAYGQTSVLEKTKLDDRPSSPVANSHNGYGYTLEPTIKADLRKALLWVAKAIANRLELSYGAVDCIHDPITGLVYALESNTAPVLLTADLAWMFGEAIANQFTWEV